MSGGCAGNRPEEAAEWRIAVSWTDKLGGGRGAAGRGQCPLAGLFDGLTQVLVHAQDDSMCASALLVP